MKDIQKMYDVVYDVLKKYPETRDSDAKLFIQVCNEVCPDPTVIARLPFDRILLDRKKFRVPNFESVGRARRKAQEKNPELRSSKKVQAFKDENEEIVLDFVRRN